MHKVDETPELVGVSNADLLPPPPVPVVAANVALKLPVFWPKAVKVWFVQADAQFAIKSITVSKTKFYHAVASLPLDVAAQILDLICGPPWRSLWGSERVSHQALFFEGLSEIWSFSFSSVDQRSEAISPHEQDVSVAPRRLQTWIYTPWFVPLSSSYRALISSVTREDFGSSCIGT